MTKIIITKRDNDINYLIPEAGGWEEYHKTEEALDKIYQKAHVKNTKKRQSLIDAQIKYFEEKLNNYLNEKNELTAEIDKESKKLFFKGENIISLNKSRVENIEINILSYKSKIEDLKENKTFLDHEKFFILAEDFFKKKGFKSLIQKSEGCLKLILTND